MHITFYFSPVFFLWWSGAQLRGALGVLSPSCISHFGQGHLSKQRRKAFNNCLGHVLYYPSCYNYLRPSPSKLPSCAPLVVVCAILARTFSGMVLWMDVGVIMFVNDLHIFLCVCVDTMYFFFIRVCVQCIKTVLHIYCTYALHVCLCIYIIPIYIHIYQKVGILATGCRR